MEKKKRNILIGSILFIILVVIIFFTTNKKEEAREDDKLSLTREDETSVDEIIEKVIEEEVKKDKYIVDMKLDGISSDTRIISEYRISMDKPNFIIDYETTLLGEKAEAKVSFYEEELNVYLEKENILIKDNIDKLGDLIGLSISDIRPTEEELKDQWQLIKETIELKNLGTIDYKGKKAYIIGGDHKEDRSKTKEFYIDSKDYLVLKQVDKYGEDIITTEYNNYEEIKNLGEKDFRLGSKNAKIMDFKEYEEYAAGLMDKMSEDMDEPEEKEITESREVTSLKDLDENILYYPEGKDYDYESGVVGDGIIALLYSSSKEDKTMMISIIDKKEYEENFTSGLDYDQIMENEEGHSTIEVENKKLYYSEEDGLKSISFSYEDNIYTIFDQDGKLSQEEMVGIYKKLKSN